MIVKKHKTSDNRLILALCDTELLGKVISEGDVQLDLGSKFYRGEELSPDAAEKLLLEAYIINAVGKECIQLCIRAKLVDSERISSVSGVPYTQMVRA